MEQLFQNSLCEICEGSKRNKADYFCMECKCFFCSNHSETFHKKGPFRLHTLVNKSQSASTICFSHKKPFEFLCDQKNATLLCQICAETHTDHNHIPLEKALSQSIEYLVNNRDVYEGLYSQIQLLIENFIKELEAEPQRLHSCINDYIKGCDDILSNLDPLGEKVSSEISEAGEYRAKRMKNMVGELNSLRLSLEDIIDSIDKKVLIKKPDFVLVQLNNDLYTSSGQLSLKKINEKIVEAQNMARYKPKLAIIGTLNSVFATKLLMNSYIDFSGEETYFSNRRYRLPVILTDDFGVTYSVNDDYFLEASLTNSISEQMLINKEQQLLVFEEDNNYFIEVVFGIGLNKIEITLNRALLARCPFSIEAEPGECGIISGELYICKGISNLCSEAAKAELILYGNNPYLNYEGVSTANVCKAAFHSGVISSNGGKFIVKKMVLKDRQYTGCTRHGIISYDYAKVTASAIQIKPIKCSFIDNSNNYACVGENDGCKPSGKVFGSGPYHSSSDVCMALLHSGRIGKDGGTALLTYKTFLGKLKGKKANNITSLDLDINQAEKVFDFGYDSCTKLKDDLFYCIGINNGCQALTKDYVWGSNPYTEDADMCGCAVHAGVIGKEGGYFRIKKMPKWGTNFEISTRNGFTSKFWNAPYNGILLEKFEEETKR